MATRTYCDMCGCEIDSSLASSHIRMMMVRGSEQTMVVYKDLCSVCSGKIKWLVENHMKAIEKCIDDIGEAEERVCNVS